jgi:hypothetical protein
VAIGEGAGRVAGSGEGHLADGTPHFAEGMQSEFTVQ